MLFFPAYAPSRFEVSTEKSEVIQNSIKSRITSNTVFLIRYLRVLFSPLYPLVSAIVTWTFEDRQGELLRIGYFVFITNICT